MRTFCLVLLLLVLVVVVESVRGGRGGKGDSEIKFCKKKNGLKKTAEGLFYDDLEACIRYSCGKDGQFTGEEKKGCKKTCTDEDTDRERPFGTYIVRLNQTPNDVTDKIFCEGCVCVPGGEWTCGDEIGYADILTTKKASRSVLCKLNKENCYVKDNNSFIEYRAGITNEHQIEVQPDEEGYKEGYKCTRGCFCKNGGFICNGAEDCLSIDGRE